MKVKSHFPDVDQLVAKIKSVTVKNKTRQAQFVTIGYSSRPVVDAALYYANNLLEVKSPKFTMIHQNFN